MIQRFIKKLSAVLALSLILATAGPALPVHAALFDGSTNVACQGTQLSDSDSTSCKGGTDQVQHIIKVALNVFSWIVGLIAIIMIIIGGLKYITSMGDSSSINGAKNTILYAVIGLAIVAVSQIIVRFVIKKTAV